MPNTKRRGFDVKKIDFNSAWTLISAEEKIRMEEGEEAYQAELKKQAGERAKEEARIAALPSEKRKALARAREKILAEFNAQRVSAGRKEYRED
jgi:hypothetical protein